MLHTEMSVSRIYHFVLVDKINKFNLENAKMSEYFSESIPAILNVLGIPTDKNGTTSHRIGDWSQWELI